MPKTQRDSLTDASSLETLLQLQEGFRRRVRPFRLSLQQAGVLLFLQRCPGANATAVGDALGLHPSSPTPILNILVRKGLITSTRPPDNRRVVVLRLTSRGEKVAREISERLRDMPNVGVWA